MKYVLPLIGALVYVNAQLPSVSNLLLQGICATELNPCLYPKLCTLTMYTIGEARCSCPEGYSGDGLAKGGTGCVDVDECSTNTHKCASNQTCINTMGSHLCTCKPGFEWNESGTICRDINECQRNPLICGGNPAEAYCVNLEGSFECQCTNPFKAMDASYRCVDKNECTYKNGSEHDCEQVCIDIENGYTCGCNEGYIVDPSNPKKCADVNECLLGTHTCLSGCKNTIGSYRCDCFEENGERADENGRCVNFNECYEYPNICGGLDRCCKDLEPSEGKYHCVDAVSVPGVGLNFNEYNSLLPKEVQQLGSAFGLFSTPTLYTNNNVNSQLNAQGTKIGECYTKDAYIQGIDIKTSVPVVSSLGCQMECSNTFGCKFFTYSPIDKKCVLKANNLGKQISQGLISGPVDCVNNIQAASNEMSSSDNKNGVKSFSLLDNLFNPQNLGNNMMTGVPNLFGASSTDSSSNSLNVNILNNLLGGKPLANLFSLFAPNGQSASNTDYNSAQDQTNPISTVFNLLLGNNNLDSSRQVTNSVEKLSNPNAAINSIMNGGNDLSSSMLGGDFSRNILDNSQFNSQAATNTFRGNSNPFNAASVETVETDVRRLQASLLNSNLLNNLFNNMNPLNTLKSSATNILPAGISGAINGLIPGFGTQYVCPTGYKTGNEWSQKRQVDMFEGIRKQFRDSVTQTSKNALYSGIANGTLPDTVIGQLGNNSAVNLLPEPWNTLAKMGTQLAGGGTQWQQLLNGDLATDIFPVRRLDEEIDKNLDKKE